MEEGNTIRTGVSRRRIVIVLAACVLVGIGVVAFWPDEKEPQYNGKKLSQWLEIYNASGPAEQRERAEVAVRQIGTNALPWLMKWIQCDRRDLPQWKTRLALAACKLKMPGTFVAGMGYGIRNNSVVGWLINDPQRSHAEFAERFGFKLLGPQAGPAIPDLLRLWEDTNSIVISLRANYAVLSIPDMVPQLASMLTNEMSSVRCRAAQGLRSFGSLKRPYPALDASEAVAVPLLVQALRDPEIQVRQEATNALHEIAPEVLTNGVKGF